MKLNRRSIFGLAAGAAVAPIVPALPAAARPFLVINRIPQAAQQMFNYWRSSSLEYAEFSSAEEVSTRLGSILSGLKNAGLASDEPSDPHEYDWEYEDEE